MRDVLDIPIFAYLPNIERARLVADLESVSLAAGDVVDLASEGPSWVYFVVEGEMGLMLPGRSSDLPLLVVGPGDMLGDDRSQVSVDPNRLAKAITEAKLVRIQAERLNKLLLANPTVGQAYSHALARKFGHTLDELARAKLMLATYTDELWAMIPTPHLQQASTVLPIDQIEIAAAALPRVRLRLNSLLEWAREQGVRFTGMVLSLLVGWMVFSGIGGDHPLRVTAAILAAASVNWLLNTLPDFAVGLAATAAFVAAGIARPAVAFAGFSNSAWFLLVGAGGLGVAVSRSGLLYRMALHMLLLLPPTYPGQSLAMALTGLLFTPLLPSANSRVAMASPLSLELSGAMRFPERGRGSAGMAMSTYLGFGLMYFLFLNGANTGLLAWSLLPEPVRHQVTWGFWFWAALPMGLIVFGLCFAAIHWLLPPEPTAGVTRETIQAQLAILGRISPHERGTATVLAMVFAGFLTQSLHGMDPALLSLAGFLALVALGILDKTGLRSIDWGFLLLFGSLVGISEVSRVTGFNTFLSDWIGPLLLPLGRSPHLFLGSIAVLTVLIRMFVPLQPTVFVMVVALLPVASELHYNPFVIALIVLALSNNWLVPQQNSVYLGVYSATEERAFTHGQVRPLAVVHALVGVLAVLVSVPFWVHLNLLP